MSTRHYAILGCLIGSLALTGCVKPHRAPVAQGNIIQKKDAERLETGMSRSQVEYLIGQPILKEPFDRARSSYVFYLRMGYETVKENRVTLHFEDDTLTRIDGDLQATADQVVENQLEQEAEADDEQPRLDPTERPSDPTDPSPDPDTP